MHSLHLSIGPATFRIASAWKRPLTLLQQLYGGYPPADPVADYTVRLDPAGLGRKWLRPSVRIAGDHMLPDAVPMALRHGLLAAEMGMNLQMALGWRRHLLLHASTVERDGRAIIMCGESGSGKSTLAAMLGERGWRFMGDEFALVDPATGLVHPFPRLVSLKNEAVGVMREWVDDKARFGPVMAGTPKGDIVHLIPPPDAIAAMRVPARPALLLFPRFGEVGEMTGMGQGEALLRLTEASTNYVALGEAGFSALTGLVASVPAISMRYASGEQAMDGVEQIWAQLP